MFEEAVTKKKILRKTSPARSDKRKNKSASRKRIKEKLFDSAHSIAINDNETTKTIDKEVKNQKIKQIQGLDAQLLGGAADSDSKRSARRPRLNSKTSSDGSKANANISVIESKRKPEVHLKQNGKFKVLVIKPSKQAEMFMMLG